MTVIIYLESKNKNFALRKQKCGLLDHSVHVMIGLHWPTDIHSLSLELKNCGMHRLVLT